MTSTGAVIAVSAAMVAFEADLRRLVRWLVGLVQTQIRRRCADEICINAEREPMMVYRLYRFVNDRYASAGRVTENCYEYTTRDRDGASATEYELPLNTWYTVAFTEGDDKRSLRMYKLHCYFKDKAHARIVFVHRPVWGDRSAYTSVLRRFVAHVETQIIDSDAYLEKYILHVNPKTNRPEWVFQRTPKTRVAPAFFTPEMRRVQTAIDAFEAASTRQLYDTTGLACSRCFLLHGPPGTGKSTMAECVAAYKNKRVYLAELTVAGLSDANLKEAMGEVKENSLVLFEELDKQVGVFGGPGATLTPNGFLCALDGGFCRLHHCYVFANCNDLEVVTESFGREALFRKGRFDRDEDVFAFTTPFDPIAALQQH